MNSENLEFARQRNRLNERVAKCPAEPTFTGRSPAMRSTATGSSIPEHCHTEHSRGIIHLCEVFCPAAAGRAQPLRTGRDPSRDDMAMLFDVVIREDANHALCDPCSKAGMGVPCRLPKTRRSKSVRRRQRPDRRDNVTQQDGSRSDLRRQCRVQRFIER